MKTIILTGHGISVRVDSGKLHIRDGMSEINKEPKEYVFFPKSAQVNHIVIYGPDGEISIPAIRWMVKNDISCTVLNWNGQLLTTMLPPESSNVKTKFYQYNGYGNEQVRLNIAKELIRAKIARTKDMLSYLNQRYPGVKTDISVEERRLEAAKSISDIMLVEGHIARKYWRVFGNIMPEHLEFQGRKYPNKPRGAADQVNAMLNFGYSLLEAECLRAIHSTGLDPHVGFLHEVKLGNNPLAYDLQEPFRFLVDLAVLQLIESKAMEKKDFIRTESFTLKLRSSGAKKLVKEINNQFYIRKAEYEKGMCSWAYIIQCKATELSQYLSSKKTQLDFTKPVPNLNRIDDYELREKIMAVPYSEWKKTGYSKGTLHYLKSHVKENKPFKVYKQVMEKLATIG